MSLIPEISDRAQRDLDEQYRWYLKNAGVEIADGFFSAFYATLDGLLIHPYIGWDRLFRGRKLSKVWSKMLDSPYENFLIYYRVERDCLAVKRVIHSARDIPRRLRENETPYGVMVENPAGAPALQTTS